MFKLTATLPIAIIVIAEMVLVFAIYKSTYYTEMGLSLITSYHLRNITTSHSSGRCALLKISGFSQ